MARIIKNIFEKTLSGWFIIELVMAAQTSISSQGTQTYQSSPMAFAVNTVSPVAEQVQTANVETEEEKMDRKWLDLLNHQLNFCLGLIAHATTSRCVNEVIKANVLAHIGRVIGDTKKSYEGFREICVNLRQTPFTVPPGFAKVEYKFTDVQLRNHLARKKKQQLHEANTRWLEYLEGEIPKSRTKKAEDSKVDDENELPTETKKRKRASKASKSLQSSVVAEVHNTPQVKPLKLKIKTAKKPKQAATAKRTTAVLSQSDQQPSQVDYQALLREHQLAQQNIILEEQLTQQMDFQPNFDDLFNGI